MTGIDRLGVQMQVDLVLGKAPVLGQQAVVRGEGLGAVVGLGQQHVVELFDLASQSSLPDPPHQKFRQGIVAATRRFLQQEALGVGHPDFLGDDPQIVLTDRELQVESHIDRSLALHAHPGVFTAHASRQQLALDAADTQLRLEDVHIQPGVAVPAQREHGLREPGLVAYTGNASVGPVGDALDPRGAIGVKGFADDEVEVFLGDVDQDGVGLVEHRVAERRRNGQQKQHARACEAPHRSSRDMRGCAGLYT
jgi:hypothetical protein